MSQPNKSGFTPTGYNVIVKMKPVEDKVGNIYLTDQHKERKQWAEMHGTVVAIWGSWRLSLNNPATSDLYQFKVRPKVGDTVLFGQYAGAKFKGLDEEEYQLLEDKQILGVGHD
jgi:co-chaperonin GroES (HSP10)